MPCRSGRNSISVQTARIEHFAYLAGLIKSHFEKKHAAWFEVFRSLVDQTFYNCQSVRAGR